MNRRLCLCIALIVGSWLLGLIPNLDSVFAQSCSLAVSISNSFASGDLKDCGYGGNNSITISVTKNGSTDVSNTPGTHGGYNLSGSGTVCVKGTSDGLPGGSQEQCQPFGSGQSAPPANNNPPPPANNGGGGPAPQQPQDVPWQGQQSQPSGNWAQSLVEPLYVYQGSATNTPVIAKVHQGWYLTVNGSGGGWLQVFVNGYVGYVIDGNGQTTRSNAGAVQAPDNNPPPPANNNGGSNAYAVGRLGDGGLDVERICNVTGKHATNDKQHAYSWGCDGVLLDKNATCALVWPEYPYALVQGGLAGWSCHPSVKFQEQPPSSNTGSGGGGSTGGSNGGSSGGSSGGNSGSSGGNTAVTCNLPTRLVSGQEGHVVSNTLNLRNGAGTDYGTITSMQKGDYFSVLSGPTCRQGYNWWYASFMGRNGYIAEGATGAYYAEPVIVVPPRYAEGCDPSCNSSNSFLPDPPPGYLWVRDTEFEKLRSDADSTSKDYLSGLSFVGWAKSQTQDYVRNWLLTQARLSTGAVGQVMSFLSESRADQMANAQIWCTRLSQLNGYWQNPSFRFEHYIALPAGMINSTVTSNPFFWTSALDVVPPWGEVNVYCGSGSW